MPLSRLQPPPQTSKQARKAYLKSGKNFEFTATQKRVSERRLELDKRAKALQAKDRQKKDNKRKREEKEAAEREAKRKRIESGKAPTESLWGKVRASQLRLNAFLARPRVGSKGTHVSDSGDGSSFDSDYDSEEAITNNPAPQAGHRTAADTGDLEAFFSSAASIVSTEMAQDLDSNAADVQVRRKSAMLVVEPHMNNNMAPSQPEDSDQALLDAQLSLSQGMFDFDIAEDDDADWLPQTTENTAQPDIIQAHNHQSHLLATPSKRKAEIADLGFASPAKSARSALSEMSPSKVNIRAQEKPDISSVASSSSKLPTPSPAKQASDQIAGNLLAMIATQDLEDDEFATDKENEDPWRGESKSEPQRRGFDRKISGPPDGSLKYNVSHSLPPADKTRPQNYSFDEDIFDVDDFGAFESGLEDEQDDFDYDLDDEALAALTAPSPFKQKSPAFAIRGAGAPVSRVPEEFRFRDISSTKKSSKGTGNETVTGATIMPPPQVTSTRLSLQSHTTQPQQDLPPETQGNSFSFDGVQDDDLAAFAERVDTSDAALLPHLETKTKRSRTIPWNHPPQLPVSQSSDDPLSQDEDTYN